jgi:DNA polymerase III epsilon subunit family exonuclease
VRLALALLDRLVELVEECGGLVAAGRAAEHLLAVATPPEEVALALLRPLVADDARLAWRGASIALVAQQPEALEDARFVVFDLETTGLAVADARICEIGAVRIHRLEPAGTFETLVAPGVPTQRRVGCLAGVPDEVLRAAPRAETALHRFSAFAGDAVLVAHNARFDTGFVNYELARLTGSRLSATVIDTLPLARNLLRGRVEKTNLASLAFFFGVSVAPCHRALPDASATAEVFLRLVDLAQERGASTVAELAELATPRSRHVGPARADRRSASM